MSAETLRALLEANAFLPSALLDDLIACHVQFDELVQDARVEAAVEECARRGVAAALVGKSGSGKPAVAAWVFDRISTDFAPIRAPVFYETEATVKEPGAFARYLLQRLLSDARAVEALDDREREKLLQQASERLAVPIRTIGHSTAGSVELPWLLKGETAREVSTTLGAAELAGSTNAVLHAIDRTIEAIAAQGLTPILVLDGTDRWLQVGAVDRRDLIGKFFGTIVRMLAERGCRLVVAVHESYLDLEEYRSGTRGFLTDEVRIPTLPDASPPATCSRIVSTFRFQAGWQGMSWMTPLSIGCSSATPASEVTAPGGRFRRCTPLFRRPSWRGSTELTGL